MPLCNNYSRFFLALGSAYLAYRILGADDCPSLLYWRFQGKACNSKSNPATSSCRRAALIEDWRAVKNNSRENSFYAALGASGLTLYRPDFLATLLTTEESRKVLLVDLSHRIFRNITNH